MNYPSCIFFLPCIPNKEKNMSIERSKLISVAFFFFGCSVADSKKGEGGCFFFFGGALFVGEFLRTNLFAANMATGAHAFSLSFSLFFSLLLL
jgi:hypothetical protein